MAASVLNAPHFQNEDEAFAYVEARLWPNGAVCPHCGNSDQKRIRKMAGETTRKGLYKCNACRKPFTVRMGTIFESSHLPLHLWLQVIHLMCASKKGISTRQIQRMLQCSMKTAWHLTHRIREAMRSGGLAPMGGAGEIVESDETFIGKKEGAVKHPTARGYAHKRAVLSLVHRGGGQVRSFHVDNANAANVYPIIDKNLSFESTLMTDEASLYKTIGRSFADHQSVEHGKDEYVRGDCHTNTLEGYFSIFKRGMKGVYQHCAEKHLHRYLAEFDFRYNNRVKLGVDDVARADIALQGVAGKRLTYQTTRH
jgi:transposase-like protein